MREPDRLATLAKVARMRENRAERAWREAIGVRAERRVEQVAADAVRQRADARAAAALAIFARDPADPQARLWREATRQSADDRAGAAVRAGHLVTEADERVSREQNEYRQREARRGQADSLVAAARTDLRRAAEDRADDEASDLHAASFRP